GTVRSASPAPTPTAPRPWPTAPVAAPSIWPSNWSARPGSSASSPPPTRCPATARPSPTPRPPVVAAPSGWPSTSVPRRSAPGEPCAHHPPPRHREGPLMPRPGFVLDVDRSTPPILFHHGEGFRLEKLPPDRSRVVYPAEPLEPLEDPEGAIRHALENPVGDSPPLRALLRPGMKLTIAFDDVSLPLPP